MHFHLIYWFFVILVFVPVTLENVLSCAQIVYSFILLYV